MDDCGLQEDSLQEEGGDSMHQTSGTGNLDTAIGTEREMISFCRMRSFITSDIR